jgi:hypothetical protein
MNSKELLTIELHPEHNNSLRTSINRTIMLKHIENDEWIMIFEACVLMVNDAGLRATNDRLVLDFTHEL